MGQDGQLIINFIAGK